MSVIKRKPYGIGFRNTANKPKSCRHTDGYWLQAETGQRCFGIRYVGTIEQTSNYNNVIDLKFALRTKKRTKTDRERFVEIRRDVALFRCEMYRVITDGS